MHGTCAVCNKEKNVHRNLSSGKLICQSCGKKDYSRHEKCSKCEKVKPVAKRTNDGKPICHACRHAQRRVSPKRRKINMSCEGVS